MSDGETKPLSDGERLDWLRLIRSENVGPVVFRQLLERYGSPARALEALPELARRAGGRRRIRICSPAEADAELAA
ncbi:MAG TPA: DNA-protecting protein DprA, partial [Kiloniellaceae bacterium]